MIGKDSDEDINKYGKAPWIFGLVLAAAAIGFMFLLADSI